jgi:hypothetical protein
MSKMLIIIKICLICNTVKSELLDIMISHLLPTINVAVVIQTTMKIVVVIVIHFYTA